MLAFYIAFGFQELPIQSGSNATNPTIYQSNYLPKQAKKSQPFHIFLQNHICSSSKENMVCI